MWVLNELEPLPEKYSRTAVAIGNFDGVHQGHAEILRRLRATGLPSVVLTFDPHPMQLLCPLAAPERLTWTERKLQLFQAQDIDGVVVCPTTLEILRWSAREFFEQILCETLRAEAVVEGSTFSFGRNREGSPFLLQQFCHERGISATIVDSLRLHNEAISSSRIRRILREGDVALANKMLTAPYRIRGTVVAGKGRGRKIGFPTANLEAIDTLLPGTGVYGGKAWTKQGCFPAAIHIGANLTFHEETPKVEVHLLGFHGNLYGTVLEVEFSTRLRDLIPFTTPEALIQQIHLDVEGLCLAKNGD